VVHVQVHFLWYVSVSTELEERRLRKMGIKATSTIDTVTSLCAKNNPRKADKISPPACLPSMTIPRRGLLKHERYCISGKEANRLQQSG
jgi:hypothetical protein